MSEYMLKTRDEDQVIWDVFYMDRTILDGKDSFGHTMIQPKLGKIRIENKHKEAYIKFLDDLGSIPTSLQLENFAKTLTA